MRLLKRFWIQHPAADAAHTDFGGLPMTALTPATRVEYRDRITRQMLRSERGALFVFGDNFARVGYGGQAREMRGEPNAVGVPTKRRPDMKPCAFLRDGDLEAWRAICRSGFYRLRNHSGQIVWPADGIGTGLAELPSRAPAIWAELETFRLELER